MERPPDRPYAHWTIEAEAGWFRTIALSPPPPHWEVYVEMFTGPIQDPEKYEAWRKLLMYKFDDYLTEAESEAT